jgi:hypothetical protein
MMIWMIMLLLHLTDGCDVNRVLQTGNKAQLIEQLVESACSLDRRVPQQQFILKDGTVFVPRTRSGRRHNPDKALKAIKKEASRLGIDISELSSNGGLHSAATTSTAIAGDEAAMQLEHEDQDDVEPEDDDADDQDDEQDDDEEAADDQQDEDEGEEDDEQENHDQEQHDSREYEEDEEDEEDEDDDDDDDDDVEQAADVNGEQQQQQQQHAVSGLEQQDNQSPPITPTLQHAQANGTTNSEPVAIEVVDGDKSICLVNDDELPALQKGITFDQVNNYYSVRTLRAWMRERGISSSV